MGKKAIHAPSMHTATTNSSPTFLMILIMKAAMNSLSLTSPEVSTASKNRLPASVARRAIRIGRELTDVHPSEISSPPTDNSQQHHRHDRQSPVSLIKPYILLEIFECTLMSSLGIHLVDRLVRCGSSDTDF
jgi:hypothetical protein